MIAMSMEERAAGGLLGTACGDALGVHYEFGPGPGPNQPARMLGAGLIRGAPGEWSDDTAMTAAVATVTAARVDPGSPAGLDSICEQFAAWVRSNPKDIGVGCAAASRGSRERLSRERSQRPAPRTAWTESARDYYERTGGRGGGGNGALMRTGPIPVALHGDREACAHAAREVARLTHAHPEAAESCILWSEAIRVALTTGELHLDAGIDLLPASRQATWAGRLQDAHAAVTDSPVAGIRYSRLSTGASTGYTVTSLQIAATAILAARDHETPFEESLHAAIRVGGDTDTTAAITGALAGALCGSHAIPREWLQQIHGWPGIGAGELHDLAISSIPAEEEPRGRGRWWHRLGIRWGQRVG